MPKIPSVSKKRSIFKQSFCALCQFLRKIEVPAVAPTKSQEWDYSLHYCLARLEEEGLEKDSSQVFR